MPCWRLSLVVVHPPGNWTAMLQQPHVSFRQAKPNVNYGPNRMMKRQYHEKLACKAKRERTRYSLWVFAEKYNVLAHSSSTWPFPLPLWVHKSAVYIYISKYFSLVHNSSMFCSISLVTLISICNLSKCVQQDLLGDNQCVKWTSAGERP